MYVVYRICPGKEKKLVIVRGYFRILGGILHLADHGCASNYFYRYSNRQKVYYSSLKFDVPSTDICRPIK